MSYCIFLCFFFRAEDGIRASSVIGVQTFVFFFQAEDGIRDSSVTGVQTCALPICSHFIAKLVAPIAAGLFATAAFAHPSLVSSTPADKSQVSAQIGRASCRERV